MISQKQNNIHWTEEETVPPLDQKPASTPASSWRGWSLWLRVLGVIVPLVASFACSFIDLSLLTMGIPFLLGVVSAGLLRSWWSILIVPVAFSMGLFLSSIFLGDGIFLSSMANPVFAGKPAYAFLAVFGVVPVAIGAAIGTPISMKIEQLLQQ
jgi:hypothetical protein